MYYPANTPFPSSPGPLFQNEGRCSAFDTEIIFHSHANKTHFHRKGCAPSLILKERVFGTRKCPIHPRATPERRRVPLISPLKIHHFHTDHNAPCLPPKILR